MKTNRSLKSFILTLDKSKVVKIYRGEDNSCRCGCRGVYYYTSHQAGGNDAEINAMMDGRVDELLNEVKMRLTTRKGRITDYTSAWINISFAPNMAICIYLQETSYAPSTAVKIRLRKTIKK